MKGCTHCRNLGLSRDLYEGHTVRNDKGFVMCPKIKSNVCWKCEKIGHLPSSCTVKPSTPKPVASSSSEVAPVKKSTNPAQVLAPVNRFSAIYSSESDEEDSKPVSTPAKKSSEVAPGAPVKLARTNSLMARPRKIDWASVESDSDEDN